MPKSNSQADKWTTPINEQSGASVENVPIITKHIEATSVGVKATVRPSFPEMLVSSVWTRSARFSGSPISTSFVT